MPTDLYEMHESVASYFKTILEIHNSMILNLKEQVEQGDIKVREFNTLILQLTLAPATLSVITTFLKTNQVMVIPDGLDEKLDDFTKIVESYKKTRVSVKDIDPKAEAV